MRYRSRFLPVITQQYSSIEFSDYYPTVSFLRLFTLLFYRQPRIVIADSPWFLPSLGLV